MVSYTSRPTQTGPQPNIRGYSSAGRALEWHSRGQRFDPAYLHQTKSVSERKRIFCCAGGFNSQGYFGRLLRHISIKRSNIPKSTKFPGVDFFSREAKTALASSPRKLSSTRTSTTTSPSKKLAGQKGCPVWNMASTPTFSARMQTASPFSGGEAWKFDCFALLFPKGLTWMPPCFTINRR